MEIVNTHDARTHLLQLLERAAKGEEFIIAKAGRPVARLVPYRGHEHDRSGGQWKGLVRIGDDFDDALPDKIAGPFREPE